MVAFALVVLWPALPAAAERTQADLVLVRAGDTIEEDLYAAGNVVQIDGTVDGDLVAAAWREVKINGVVRGDVVAVASRVVIDGRVDGSVRVVARRLLVEGEVGDDLWAAAGDLSQFGAIGRDLFVWGWRADVGGRIGRDLGGWIRSVRVRGTVGRDVEVTVTRLEAGPGSAVKGDLVYVSERPAAIAPESEVGGSTIQRRPLPPNIRIRALGLLAWVVWGLGMSLVGVFLLWVAPLKTTRAAEAVRRRPLASLLWGVGLAAIPVAMVAGVGVVGALAPPEAGIPLLVVLVPVVLLAALLAVAATVLGPIPTGSALGRILLPGGSPYAWVAAGMLVVVVATRIPWVGPIVLVAAILVGLGGWLDSLGEEQSGGPSSPP